MDNPIKFNDGNEKVINFRPFIGEGFTKELLDYAKFKQVFIEPGGGIAWKHAYDFCPNYLKELVKETEKCYKIHASDYPTIGLLINRSDLYSI